MISSGKARLPVWRAAALVGAAWFAYAPALNGGWLRDDAMEVTQNTAVTDPSAWRGLAKIWRGEGSWDYFPLKSTVQWLEWRCWGNHPFGYHLISLGLHVLSAFLVWRLLLWLARSEGAAAGEEPGWPWLAGLVFSVHPLAVESVAWISELKNTLSLPLLLLAFWTFIEADKRRRSGRDGTAGISLLSLGLFVASLLSKSSGVMLPAVLLLHAWWRRGKLDRRDAAASAPYFAVSLALGLVTVGFQSHRAIAGLSLPASGWGTRGAAAGLSLAFYLWKTAWPAGLLPIYPRWSIHPREAISWLPWLGLVLLAVWLGKRRRGWGRHALFGFGWFGLNLLPVLGFVPMVYLRGSWVADHFAYLSLLGPIGLAAAGFGLWQSRLEKSVRRAAWVGAGALCALLAVEARAAAGHYRSEEELWAWAVRADPAVADAHNNLGNVRFGQSRLPEAAEEYRAALRLDPGLSDAQANLGLALAGLGRLPEAIETYRAELRLDPDDAAAHLALGNLLARTGRLGEAAEEYRAALSHDAGLAEAHGNLAAVLQAEGRLPEAVEEYRAALRLMPGSAFLHRQLGAALLRCGRRAEAAEEFQTSLRLAKPAGENRRQLRID